MLETVHKQNEIKKSAAIMCINIITHTSSFEAVPLIQVVCISWAEADPCFGGVITIQYYISHSSLAISRSLIVILHWGTILNFFVDLHLTPNFDQQVAKENYPSITI